MKKPSNFLIYFSGSKITPEITLGDLVGGSNCDCAAVFIKQKKTIEKNGIVIPARITYLKLGKRSFDFLDFHKKTPVGPDTVSRRAILDEIEWQVRKLLRTDIDHAN